MKASHNISPPIDVETNFDMIMEKKSLLNMLNLNNQYNLGIGHTQLRDWFIPRDRASVVFYDEYEKR